MTDELKQVELETAKLRLERERLALDSEKRKLERGRVALDIAREVAITTVAAGGIARTVATSAGNGIARFFRRLFKWLFVWAAVCCVVALIGMLLIPFFQVRPYFISLAYWFGVFVGPSVPYLPAPALLTSVLRALFPDKSPILKLCMIGAIWWAIVSGLNAAPR